MPLFPRDVAGYADPSEVAGLVQAYTISGYLNVVVAAVLMYDTGEQPSVKYFPCLSMSMTVCTLDKEVSKVRKD